jgi:16S rRNA (cytidine1402-2'-O)-methyltransferase
LESGKSLALVTDAGTPGISDPGNRLIAECRMQNAELRIVTVPGPSALTAALSVSGFPTDKFLFLGFPPHKGRAKFFKEVDEAQHTVVFYESNHRIKKCLGELIEILDKKRQICVCRELTKQFETIYRGTIDEILKKNIPERGEFVVIINANFKMQNAK